MPLKTTSRDLIYRLLPVQIPYFWEAIKFACVEADSVREENRASYFNKLLHALLNSKAQCFIIMDDNRVLNAVMITKLITNVNTDQKELFIQCLYSLKMMDNSSMQSYFNFIRQFAEHEDCKAIIFSSANPRVWQLAEAVGFTELDRSFALRLGGA
jgi:hypothetical protein